MGPSTTRLAPDDAERRLRAMLLAADLPLFESTAYHAELDWFEVTWAHGLTMHFDLARGLIDPFDELDRRAILGLGLGERFPLPANALIDLAEVLSREQLREAFRRLSTEGLLDGDSVRAARQGAEERPSDDVLDEVIEEFCG